MRGEESRIVMKKVLITLTLSVLLLISCVTGERSYTFSSSEGMKVFLRPVALKGERSVELDMTFSLDKSKISGDSILNYSVIEKKGSILDTSSLFLTFETDEGPLYPRDNELMYVEARGKEKREIRFSSLLSLSDTLIILEDNTPEVRLHYDGKTISLDSSQFIKSLESVKAYLL